VYELKQVLKKMDIHPTHYQVMEMIRSVDDDCSGSIDFDEFLVLMQSRVGAGGPEQDLRQAFLQFDKSKTGYITKEDLKKTMIEFDNALTDEECNAMFSEVDLDGDGRITFREFRELMVRHVTCVCLYFSYAF
jgi:Ca2+-binding EF-hand superfamily protein